MVDALLPLPMRLGYPTPAEPWQAVGCEQCQQTDYWGRTGVFEVWHLDSAMDQAILAHVDEIERRQQRRQRGGAHCLLDDALEKAAQGLTSLAEAQTLGGQGACFQQVAGQDIKRHGAAMEAKPPANRRIAAASSNEPARS